MKEGVELVKWFSEMSNKDVAIAGGKGASLAEMYNSGFPVPPGFVVTAQAYQYFINSSGIASEMHRILSNTNVDDTNALTRASEKIRAIIENAELPKNMEEAITEAYDVLDVEKNYSGASKDAMSILKHSHEPPFVAVRSSATAEDLVDASFAGQQDSFLSVKGKKELIEKIKKCISSLFTPRAIYYRQKKGFAHESTYLAVVVQRMIDSDKSGVMFSKNPIKDDGNVVIEAVWGLGEGIVSGRVSPDHYVVNKEMEVLEMSVSDKKEAMVRKSSGGIEVVKLVEERSKQQVLTGHEIKRLAQYGLDLEEHYKKPQDIEFAIEKGQIYIVQSRPITTKAHVNVGHIEGHSLLSGMGASPGVGSGPVVVVLDLKDLDNVKKGDILVTKMTNPDMVVAMQRAAGIITDEGGVTSHAAIVSREMGIPAVVGTRDATHKLKTGQIVTVDGNTGRILEGKAQEKKVEIKQIVPTKTKIKVIVDLPDYAIRAASSGALGVGLVRLETIIAASGKHPVLFLKNNKMKDYVSILYSGLKKIVSNFDEVWVRSSDIRSDEFRNLEGAPQKVEGNPMMGDHGIRFTLKNYDMMEAEFMAVKEIADEFPDKKIGFMAPQIISVEELRAFKKVGAEVGLPENVKIGIMVETPAAVEIIDLLCDEGIDFISLGTNDLTQFTLALDRNNEDVQNLYTEMHPAVLRSIERVLSVCNEKGVETSICGQAGSKPEMASFLVKNGISSISVNADAAFMVSQTIAKIEEEVVDEEPMIVPKNNNKNTQIFDEEAIILKALEDEYSPGLSAASEVPNLNDAIPIDSDAFVGQKKEEYFEL